MNDDPTDDPAYQAWLADLATQCRCSHDRPCAGLMAGGFCDELDWSEDDYEIDFDDEGFYPSISP